MDTPFFGGTYKSLSTKLADNRCVNLYPEMVETHEGKQIGAFYSTPGEKYLATIGTGTVRGVHAMPKTRKLVVVVGNTVYTYDQNGAVTTIGTLGTSTGTVEIIDNGDQFMVADGFEAWTYSGTWAVTPLVNPVSITVQDGYGIANQSGTNQFYQSNLNDLTVWDGLNFSSADSEPSPILGIRSLFRQLWIFKQNSTEIWNNAGLSGFAFARMNGAYLQEGCIASHSVAVVGDRLMWLGQNDQGSVSVYMNNGYSAERVSTHSVEYAILGYMQINTIGVSDAVGFGYNQAGHEFYVLTFPNADATWVYDKTTRLWHERGEYINGEYHRWDANGYGYFNDRHVVGSASGNILYTLELSYPVDDLPTATTVNPKRWMRRWRALPKHANSPIRFPSLRLDMSNALDFKDYTNSTYVPLQLTGHIFQMQQGTASTYEYGYRGGLGNVTFSLSSGTLPTGLTLASNGTLSGIPTASGTFTYTLQGVDAYGQIAYLTDTATVISSEVINWRLVSGLATSQFTCAWINGNTIVAGYSGNAISYSTDRGTTFHTTTLGTPIPVRGLTYWNGEWWAFGPYLSSSYVFKTTGGNLASFTGTTTPFDLPQPTGFCNVAWTDGTLLYASENTVTSGTYKIHSYNGTSWTTFDTGVVCRATNNGIGYWLKVSGTLLVGTTDGYILRGTSFAGMSIVYTSASNSVGITSLCIKGSTLIASCSDNTVITSTNNGATWTTSYTANGGTNGGTHILGNGFMFASMNGSDVYTSDTSTASSWTDRLSTGLTYSGVGYLTKTLGFYGLNTGGYAAVGSSI